MNFRLWKEYGALNSQPVFDAFSKGCKVHGYNCTDTGTGIDVIWSMLFNGRMSNNERIWRAAQQQNKSVVVLEVGNVTRGVTWKVGVNGINRGSFDYISEFDESRPSRLGLHLTDWRKSGKYILLCGQHGRSAQWQGMPNMKDWVCDTIQKVREHTDRPIVFRPHPRYPVTLDTRKFKDVLIQRPIRDNKTKDEFPIDFSNIWATISYNSNPGIQSILHGVPAFVSDSSLACDVAERDIAKIETPCTPDRTDWLCKYAHTEYTLEEISQGFPLEQLTNSLI